MSTRELDYIRVIDGRKVHVAYDPTLPGYGCEWYADFDDPEGPYVYGASEAEVIEALLGKE